ncbi:MAG: PIG-L family deacetylase, partial [Corynebacterium casei]|nr:PIG-L family deacetylase [Corynebacterium casei]
NHIDHRITGEAVVDAIRDTDNPWTHRDLSEQPWKADHPKPADFIPAMVEGESAEKCLSLQVVNM